MEPSSLFPPDRSSSRIPFRPRFFCGHRKQLGAAACMAEEEKEGCVHIFHSLYDAFGHPVSSYYGRGKCLNHTFNLFCLLREFISPSPGHRFYLLAWFCTRMAMRRWRVWKLASPPLPPSLSPSLPNGLRLQMRCGGFPA